MRRARWLILTLDQCQPVASLQPDLGCPVCDKARVDCSLRSKSATHPLIKYRFLNTPVSWNSQDYWKGGMVGLWHIGSQVSEVGWKWWPIYSHTRFVTERQNDSPCLFVFKQILAEHRVATRLGALRIGSDLSSCRGPSMRGIALV